MYGHLPFFICRFVACLKLLTLYLLLNTSQLTPHMVNELAHIKPIMEHVRIQDLQAQLPAYLAAAARAPTHSLDDVATYTESILTFWRTNTTDSSMSAWRLAARIIFSFSPNSASCERVFSLLDCMLLEMGSTPALQI